MISLHKERVQQELEQSATFGCYANEFSNSVQNHTGKLQSQHQLKLLLNEFFNKLLATPGSDRKSLWESFCLTKFGDKGKSITTHVLTMFLSIDKHKNTSKEIIFLSRMLNDKDINKEVLQKIKKARDACCKIKGYMAGTNLVNLDDCFLTKTDLITFCKKAFPDKKNQDLDIVHWVRDQKAEIIKLKKTNKDLSNTLSNNIKNSNPSVSLVLDYLTGILVKEQKDSNEKVQTKFETRVKPMREKHNETCSVHGSEEKAKTLEKPIAADVYIEVNSQEKTAKKPYEHKPFEDVRDEMLAEMSEQKSETETQTRQIAHKVREMKQNANIMLAMLKQNDKDLSGLKSEIDQAVKVFNDVKNQHSSNSGFMRHLFTTIGINGFTLFNDGTQLKDSYLNDTFGKIKGSGNKYFDDLNNASRKMVYYIDKKVKQPSQQAVQDPSMFKHKKTVYENRLKAYKDCFDEFKNTMGDKLRPSQEEDYRTTKNKVSSSNVAEDSETFDMLGPKMIKTNKNVEENPHALAEAKNNMVYCWKARDNPRKLAPQSQTETPRKPDTLQSSAAKNPSPNINKSPFAGKQVDELNYEDTDEEEEDDDPLVYDEDDDEDLKLEDDNAQPLINFDDIHIEEDEPEVQKAPESPPNDAAKPTDTDEHIPADEFDQKELEKPAKKVEESALDTSKLTVSTNNLNKSKQPQSPMKVLGMHLASSPLSSEKTSDNEVDFDTGPWVENISKLEFNIPWEGGEGHNGQVKETSFTNLVLDEANKFTGNGKDDSGAFSLSGDFDPTSEQNVILEKKYPDSTDPTIYCGTLDCSKYMISGDWILGVNGNGFKVYANLNKWDGNFTNAEGESTKIQVFLNITDKSIIGMGNEMVENGKQFLVKGFVEAGKDVKIIRYNLDGSGEKSYYLGRIYNGKVIKGKHKNEDKTDFGKFRIKLDSAFKRNKDLSGIKAEAEELPSPSKQDIQNQQKEEERLRKQEKQKKDQEDAERLKRKQEREEQRLRKKEEAEAERLRKAQEIEDERIQKAQEVEHERLRKEAEEEAERLKREKEEFANLKKEEVEKLKAERAEQRRIKREKQRLQREEDEKLRKKQELEDERLRKKYEQEAEMVRKDQELADQLRKEDEERAKREKEEERKRKIEEAEKEAERLRKKQEREEGRQRKKEQLENERLRKEAEEEAEKLRKEQELADQLKRDEEEKIKREKEEERIKREKEDQKKKDEAERLKKKQQKEEERLRKKAEEEAERLKKAQQEEAERIKKEKEEEAARLEKEKIEFENLKKEEVERIKKEREEQRKEKREKKQKEREEAEKLRKKQELEDERLRKKAEDDAEKARKTQERAEKLKQDEAERIKKEKEAERQKKLQEDNKKKEEEDRKKKAEEEKKRKEEERKKKEEEEKKKKEEGKGLIIKNVKAEIQKLVPKEDPHHNVLYTFLNNSNKKLTYYMITKEDPMRNMFDLEPGMQFTEDFTIQYDWVIMDGHNQIAAYNPKISLGPETHVTLCTSNPNKTTEELGVQSDALTVPIASDPRTRAEDFKLVVQEDERELKFNSQALDLDADTKFVKFSNSEANTWDRMGSFKNKKVNWKGKLGKHDLIIEHMEFTFENQVQGRGEWMEEAYNIEGEISEKGNQNLTFVFTHSKMRFTLEGSPGKQNMFDGAYSVVEDSRVDHKLGSQLKGQWSLKLDCVLWQGTTKKSDTKLPMFYYLNVDEGGIFGFGFEHKNGLYIIRGDYEQNLTAFKFAKYYAEGTKDTVIFKGHGSDIQDGHYLAGMSASIGDITNISKFKIKGTIEPGPDMKKKIWWNWGANLNMNASWDGWKTVDSEKVKTKYAFQIINMQFAFFDYVISGNGEDDGGKYTITGMFESCAKVTNKALVDPSKEYDVDVETIAKVTFDKHYANKIIVSYSGEFSENDCMSGRYKKLSAQGKLLEEGDFYQVQGGFEFKGIFKEQKGPQQNVVQRMAITTKGIFGVGKDDIGPYIVRGDLNIKDRTVVMAQNYQGQKSYIMVGRWNIHKGDIVIRGMYDLRELTNRKIVVPESGGDFELTAKFGLFRHMNPKPTKLAYEEYKDKLFEPVDHGNIGAKAPSVDLSKSMVPKGNELNKSQVQTPAYKGFKKKNTGS